MKRILIILSAVLLAAACNEDPATDQTYDSTITPVIAFDDSSEIIAGVTYVQFTNASTAVGTELTEFFWHFGFAGEGNWSEEFEPDPILYKTPGEYTVTLTAYGADGNQASVKRTLTVLAANAAPTAEFTYSPAVVYAGTEVTFTDKSTDSDGEIASRKWSFSDGATAEGESVTHTFASAGVFTVTLEVADDRGEPAAVTKAVSVRSSAVTAFTVNWSLAVAQAGALYNGGVVAVSNMGNIYFASGEGKLVAVNPQGQKIWEYDANPDGIDLSQYVSYPSVDSDGTVFWAAHGPNVSHVYAFDGETGEKRWENTTAFAGGARIYFSTPCITPDFVAVGNRGTSGHISALSKSTGKAVANATPANGGVDSVVAMLKNGTTVYTVSGDYGIGLMLPDPTFTWMAVPTASGFTPGTILTGRNTQLCIGADDCVYMCGSKKNSGTWNIACFDCSHLEAAGTKSPKWTQDLPGEFQRTGASLSADGSTLYIISDYTASEGLACFALNTSNGAVKWSYPLTAKSTSVPAVDNLGNIHFCTVDGNYIVLKDNGNSCAEVYKEKVADGFEGSPTLSPVDGCAYAVGSDGASGTMKLYAISFPEVSGPADSAWAQYGQNAAHSNYQK